MHGIPYILNCRFLINPSTDTLCEVVKRVANIPVPYYDCTIMREGSNPLTHIFPLGYKSDQTVVCQEQGLLSTQHLAYLQHTEKVCPTETFTLCSIYATYFIAFTEERYSYLAAVLRLVNMRIVGER